MQAAPTSQCSLHRTWYSSLGVAYIPAFAQAGGLILTVNRLSTDATVSLVSAETLLLTELDMGINMLDHAGQRCMPQPLQ